MESMVREVQMKNIIFKVIFLFIVGSLNSFAYGNYENWFDKVSKIKVGISTKQEVEELFNFPTADRINKFNWNENVYYKTKEGMLRISYSLGNCSEGLAKYNLEKGTVLSFFFSAIKPISISNLKLDLTEFKSQKESDTGNWYYSNSDFGVTYILFENKIFEVDASLTEKQKNQYACSEEP